MENLVFTLAVKRSSVRLRYAPPSLAEASYGGRSPRVACEGE
ncbi:MAG TPA: hypothetical protein VJ951_10115 [Bacteroidales bacterium]|nr:hypothetical protein [Bacteroidales bacterium]